MKKSIKTLLIIAFSLFLLISSTACIKINLGGGEECKHSWVEKNSTVGTCTIEGTKTFECSKCEETKTEKTGFGAHPTKWAFDDSKHWKENTCTHVSSQIKNDHVIVGGVCECGYVLPSQTSILDIVDGYNNLKVLENGVNFTFVYTTYNNANNTSEDIRFEFKDKIGYFYEVGGEKSCVMLDDGDLFYMGYLYEGQQWIKLETEDFEYVLFGEGERIFKELFAWMWDSEEKLLLKNILQLSADGYVSDGDNKWVKEVSENNERIIVTAKNGKLDTMECYINQKLVQKFVLTYGSANLSNMPEVDRENAVEPDGGPGPSSFPLEVIRANYNNLKVFEQGQNYRVVFTGHEQVEGFVYGTITFDVVDNVVKATISESGTIYMLIEDDTFYMLQGTRWGKAEKDKALETIFGTNPKTIGSLIESLYQFEGFGVFPVENYENIGNNIYTANLTSKGFKVNVKAGSNAEVLLIEFYSLNNNKKILSFDFMYGSADVGIVPTPDPNAGDLFGGGNTDAPSRPHTLESAIEKMSAIKAFDESNNLRVKDMIYVDGEWISCEERWGVGNIIYSPSRAFVDNGSSIFSCESWVIFDGEDVHVGLSWENIYKDYPDGLHEFYNKNGREATIALIKSYPLVWQTITIEEFIEEFGSGNEQSINEVLFYDDGIWDNPYEDLRIYEGVNYTQISQNQYVSDREYDGNIITVTISDNGYISEILYCDANTGEPKWKYVYEFGNVELPEIPNYNK